MAKLVTIGRIADGERFRLPWEDEPFDEARRATPEQVAEILREFKIGEAA